MVASNICTPATHTKNAKYPTINQTMKINPIKALERLQHTYKIFEHRGQQMSKEAVRAVLLYCIANNTTPDELTDEEIDQIIKS